MEIKFNWRFDIYCVQKYFIVSGCVVVRGFKIFQNKTFSQESSENKICYRFLRVIDSLIQSRVITHDRSTIFKVFFASQ